MAINLDFYICYSRALSVFILSQGSNIYNIAETARYFRPQNLYRRFRGYIYLRHHGCAVLPSVLKIYKIIFLKLLGLSRRL